MSFETLAIILVAISIGAFSKGLTGIGLPTIAIPILAGFLGVEHAVVVMTIPVAASNVVIVWSYRRMWKMMPGVEHAGVLRDREAAHDTLPATSRPAKTRTS